MIWAAEAMIDVGPVFVQNGGYSRVCKQSASPAPQSVSGWERERSLVGQRGSWVVNDHVIT